MKQSGDESISLPGRFAVFSTNAGKPAVVARFENNDVWLTQKHLAELFSTSKQLISHHIKNILESGELSESTTVKKYLTIGEKLGKQVEIARYHYNLDMIIALGYRIDSPIAIRFRQWATVRLHELIQKGFALEDERLKAGGNRYFGGFGHGCWLARVRSRMMRLWRRRNTNLRYTASAKCASLNLILTRRSRAILEMMPNENFHR